MSNKILCVGLVCVDLIQNCESYPEEDSDQRSLDCWWQRGGNASNNCTVLTQLGGECEFFGTISDGMFSVFVKGDFDKHCINTEHCVLHKNREFTLSTVIINSRTGSRTIIHSNKQWPELTFEDFLKLNIKEYTWIHFEGRNIGEIKKMMKHINEQKDSGLISINVSVEFEKPNTKLLELAPLADVVFIGKEFALHCNWKNMEEAVSSIKNHVKQSATVICAWGEKGARGMHQDCEVVSPSFPPPKMVDTLGAGDTFCATVIYLLSQSVDLKTTLEVACMLAGAKVGIVGFNGLGDIYRKLKTNAA